MNVSHAMSYQGLLSSYLSNFVLSVVLKISWKQRSFCSHGAEVDGVSAPISVEKMQVRLKMSEK